MWIKFELTGANEELLRTKSERMLLKPTQYVMQLVAADLSASVPAAQPVPPRGQIAHIPVPKPKAAKEPKVRPISTAEAIAGQVQYRKLVTLHEMGALDGDGYAEAREIWDRCQLGGWGELKDQQCISGDDG